MALTGTPVTTTTAANLLVSRWKREIQLDANEEAVIGPLFWDADGEKIGNALYVRKVAIIAASTPTSGSLDTGSLTYTGNTEARTTVSPVSRYNAVSIGADIVHKMLTDTELATAYRKQLGKGLWTAVDVTCGTLAASVSGTAGDGTGHITRPLLTSALKTLIVAGKEAVKPETTKYFVYHSSEHDSVLNIPEITAADVRGDGTSATVTGYVWKAFGLQLFNSGNIYQASNISHNMLFVKPAFILAWNERPNVRPPQDDGLAVNFFGYCEYGAAENYDSYAVDIQTAA